MLVIWLKLLILDEPTEGIQPNIVQKIGDLIVQLNQQLGLRVLLVEQKLAFAKRRRKTRRKSRRRIRTRNRRKREKKKKKKQEEQKRKTTKIR